MRIILFRHGPAGSRDPERWPDDALRPLSARGEGRTFAAAAGLARLEPKVHLIATSPLARATQTASAIESAYQDATTETVDALKPGASYRRLLEFLAERSDVEPLVLVGHEPDLGKLAGTLLFGAPVVLAMKKAGGCAIEFDGEPRAGAGKLCWFLPPKALRRLAGKKSRV